jgi:hypothetical protein
LAARGHHILVAGRNLDRAKVFCAGLANADPVVADRNRPLDQLLREQRPALLIDAAGPFQSSGYQVPLACVRAGVHYLDLADARAFVTGIGALDRQARDGGVAIVAGASSVPALSGAVARHLATGMDDVETVDIAISASNSATAGASVSAAILSYVGKPVRLWQGERWIDRWGWQDLRRRTFAAGNVVLRGRWLALADVPDLDLIPAMLPGRPAVIFRAGTGVAIQTLGLWLLSWPARFFHLGVVGLAPLLLPLQRITGRLGDELSAMAVRLTGRIGDTLIEREWVLVADHGDGPEIPTLAAVLLAEALLSGAIPNGACDAGRLLLLDDFAPLFATLSVKQDIRERRLAD